MVIAAVFAIVLAFVGKLGAVLQTIPTPVMGGILVILFGSIVAVGASSLVKAQVDLTETRNLVIMAVILVFAVGGMAFHLGEFTVEGIGLAGIVGVLLNQVLPGGRGPAEPKA
jgi:uracil permease